MLKHRLERCLHATTTFAREHTNVHYSPVIEPVPSSHQFLPRFPLYSGLAETDRNKRRSKYAVLEQRVSQRPSSSNRGWRNGGWQWQSECWQAR